MSSRLLNGREHKTTEHTVVRSGKLKRKPFNSNVAGHLLIVATFAFSYPIVLSDTSNICIIFYVADVDALYDRALAAGYQPATVLHVRPLLPVSVQIAARGGLPF